jgi:hypothetical protein
MVVSLLTLTLVAETPPILTVALEVKCSPAIVTTVPPASAPLAGSTAVTVGVYNVVTVVPVVVVESVGDAGLLSLQAGAAAAVMMPMMTRPARAAHTLRRMSILLERRRHRRTADRLRRADKDTARTQQAQASPLEQRAAGGNRLPREFHGCHSLAKRAPRVVVV